MKVGSRVPIEITNCTRYSVGEAVGEQEDEDIDPKKRSNIPVLWMEGRNTWFEISPSPEYRPIYRSICDAIRLYYAVLDVYVNLSSKAINRHSKSSDPIKRLSPIFFQVRTLAFVSLHCAIQPFC